MSRRFCHNHLSISIRWLQLFMATSLLVIDLGLLVIVDNLEKERGFSFNTQGLATWSAFNPGHYFIRLQRRHDLRRLWLLSSTCLSSLHPSQLSINFGSAHSLQCWLNAVKLDTEGRLCIFSSSNLVFTTNVKQSQINTLLHRYSILVCF